jgi:vacuolar protein sorting-associated protein 13D
MASMNEDNLNLSFNTKDFRSDENIFHIEDIDETVKGSLDSINDDCHCDIYSVDIRNMNLYSLDTTSRKGFRLSALPRAEEFYSCQEDAIAILHDTAIRLEICRKLEMNKGGESSSASFISASEGGATVNVEEKVDQLIVSGSIINPLRLSLKRQQYEQLLDTIDNAFKVPADLTRPPTETTKFPTINEETENFSKKALFSQGSLDRKSAEMLPKVMFSLPVFIIQLNHENTPVVEICFRDFNVNYEKVNLWETQLQVSLRSVIMEDLLREIDSKHRIMVSSANDEHQRLGTPFLSNSCPNLTGVGGNYPHPTLPSSLPDNLEPNVGFKQFMKQQKLQKVGFLSVKQPGTPPPSPQSRPKDNLVIYSSIIVDPSCPQFESKYKSRRARSSIDFNCLSLNVSVESWFVLLNFFGLVADDSEQFQGKSSSETKSEEFEVHGKSELDITVRSLTLVLVKPDYELAKANVSNARLNLTKIGAGKTIEGSLGSISLNDLTQHGVIYREKFMTSGNEALNFLYTKEASKPLTNKRSLKKDAQLNIRMSSVRYVHTKRFVMEIQTFFKDLFKLQVPVMRKMNTRQLEQHRPTQLGLEIFAESPLILLPLSSRSDKLIVANLGELSLKNEFKMSNDRETISVRREKYGPIELLDVMMVDLLHTDLFAGCRIAKSDGNVMEREDCLDMGTYLLYKVGPSLLKDKCHLKLQIERNLDSWRSHNVDDISVHGTLSKLEAELDLQQYKLVRGFLSFNLGEEIDDVYESSVLNNIYDSSVSLNVTESVVTWNNLSITLDLQNVSVSLKHQNCGTRSGSRTGTSNPGLACINFIKSTLKVDSKSDGSQDIDLISQEILISDTRVWGIANEINPVVNVFTNILKPMSDRGAIIQAEIHSRKRADNTQFTILLNNMRLMMILDWLELARDFILQNEDQPMQKVSNKKEPTGTFELKLNITDSELVFVESTDRLDSNAVILKSTTVLNYRPHEVLKTMSINLNNLEVFSCALNAEEETALSIIDPVTINMEIKHGTLGIHLQKQLLIRLSYHDVKMFQRMMQSLPQQTRNARNRKNIPVDDGKHLQKLRALGEILKSFFR